jgi:type IV secretory pathway VirJ component
VFAPLLVAAAAASHLVVATSRGDQSLTIYAPAPSAAPARAGVVVLVLSGEGGWRAFDEQLARWLADDGYWVGGFDCLHYFWKAQDDRVALAVDVRKVVDALAGAAGSTASPRVIFAGYSFGADLAPWIAGAPPRDPRIAGLVMIGPDRRGSLEFRITELMGMTPKNHLFDTASALADAKAIPVLFVHGAADDSSDAPALAAGFAGRKELAVIPSATHHFAGHEAELRRAIVESIPRLLAR